MNKQIIRLACCLGLTALFPLAPTTLCADKRDFSGSYTLKQKSGAKLEKGNVSTSTLQVTQTEFEIEVTKIVEGRKNVNRFPLNGSPGTYLAPSGTRGTCKAQLESKYLLLDMFVTTLPGVNTSKTQMHTRERWELSSDSKTLKIQTDVDFPQPSGALKGFQVIDIEHWSETYIRN
jgi:hypothetical protein